LGNSLSLVKKEGKMPKSAPYKVVWLPAYERYEVLDTAENLMIMDFSSPLFRALSLDTPGWYAWLETTSSFHFCSQDGFTLTARKEARARGAHYWVGYRKVKGKLRKHYLGTSRNLTQHTLEAAAQKLALPREQQAAQPVKRFNHTLPSALEILGFSAIPTAKVLRERYASLSKKHHPDLGGRHLDMVAINLAYAYLKQFY
jgi:hypothetical protein